LSFLRVSNTPRHFTRDWQKYSSGGLWGFVSTDGQLTIQPQFEATLWFSDARAPVRIDGRWGYVDKAGILVIPAQYGQASIFENGRAFVALEKEWFAINRDSERIARDPDDLIPDQRMGKWGFITPDGNVAVDFRYDGVQSFSEGLAAFRSETVGDSSIGAAAS
jgi:hypothetical protein